MNTFNNNNYGSDSRQVRLGWLFTLEQLDQDPQLDRKDKKSHNNLCIRELLDLLFNPKIDYND